MKVPQNDHEKRVIRLLNGDLNQEEGAEFSEWINKSEENRNEFFALKDVWDASRRVPDHTEPQLAEFYRYQYRRAKTSQKIYLLSFVAVAAILVAALVLTVLLPATEKRGEGKYQLVTVPLGSKSKIRLADGTEIILNAGSELRYAATYSETERWVELKGEAYFTVRPDSLHPFNVSTRNFDIKVTGTQFNVSAYEDDILASATLAEGKIQLQPAGMEGAVAINPGEKFTFNSRTKAFSASPAFLDQETAWKNGEFIFRKIEFTDLKKRLERWYDVQLICSDTKLSSMTYSGKFRNQETIWQVLDALKLTSPIDYRRISFREFEIIYKPKQSNYDR